MIRSAEAAGAQWRLVYGGRQRASMAFLDELAAYGDRVTVWPQDEKGFIDLDGLLGQPQPGTKVYCCGPEPLLNAVEQRCTAWPKGSLHVERFVAKPLTEPVLHEAFEVHLAQSDLTLTVPPDKSILTRDRGGRNRRPVLLPGRHLRHLRDTRPRGRPRPPRLRPRPGGPGRQRLHDDLRLPRLHPSPRPRHLMSHDTPTSALRSSPGPASCGRRSPRQQRPATTPVTRPAVTPAVVEAAAQGSRPVPRPRRPPGRARRSSLPTTRVARSRPAGRSRPTPGR